MRNELYVTKLIVIYDDQPIYPTQRIEWIRKKPEERNERRILNELIWWTNEKKKTHLDPNGEVEKYREMKNDEYYVR